MFSNLFNKTQVYTENGALSYGDSGSKVLNLFFKTNQGLDESKLIDLVKESLDEDLLETLKVIFHARDPRGGKKWKDVYRFTFSNPWGNYENLRLRLLNNPLFWYLSAEYGSWKTTIQLGMNLDCNSNESKTFIKVLSDQLISDYKSTKNNVSLVGKWAPSPNKSLAKKYRDSYSNLLIALNMKEKSYRKMLVTLRQKIDIVESKMCSNQWDSIDYSKVPSIAMNLYRKAFEIHDKQRFTQWIEGLSNCESKINARTLYPHTITKALLFNNNALQEKVIEAQWKTLVDELKSKGRLNGVIPMCDVSGSMNGTPMYVCLALGLMVSELNNPPFKDLIITFTNKPSFFKIKGSTLKDRISSFNDMEVGYNTNFGGAFKVLLDKARGTRVTQEDMPRTILVFSDCQFDEFDKGNLSTNLDGIKSLYSEYGYTMPQLVFWNLRGDTMDYPSCSTPGVSLVSGFSESLLKALMNDCSLEPKSILNTEVLSNPRYQPIEALLIDYEANN
jgi:hypothetical protein